MGEYEYNCVGCGCEIGPDQSANAVGRCDACFDELTPDERDRLFTQELMLSELMRSLYPCLIVDMNPGLVARATVGN